MHYSIENKIDKSVGNVFPQVTCTSLELAHQICFDEFSNFERKILFKLQPGAILTDVLSQAAISAHGLLVNSKVKEILSHFNLISHRYYECLVYDSKGESHMYYWLHLVDNSYSEKIDYSKSIFYWTQNGFRQGVFHLRSFEEYLKKKSQNGILWGMDSEFIVLNKKFDSTVDLFSCIPFDQGIYISERLKDSYLESQGTGISLNATSKIKT